MPSTTPTPLPALRHATPAVAAAALSAAIQAAAPGAGPLVVLRSAAAALRAAGFSNHWSAVYRLLPASQAAPLFVPAAPRPVQPSLF